MQIKLSELDFLVLVAGGEIDKDGVGIILVDIGWDRMAAAIEEAKSLATPGPPARCEFCDNDTLPVLMRLSDVPASPFFPQGIMVEEYIACPNCMVLLVNLSLSPAQFLAAEAKGGSAKRFYLHSDFYDPASGEALQPRLPAPARRE